MDPTATGNFELVAPQMKWMPRWVRENFTPKAIWWVLGVVFVAGGTVSTYAHWLNDAEKARATDHALLERQSDSLIRIDLHLATIDERLKNVVERVNEHQEEWDRVHEGAEIRVPKSPKHKGSSHGRTQ